MVGIEFYDLKAADVLAACREAGLLVLTAKTRLRLLPPLTLSEHDVDMALEILSDVLGKMEPTAPKEQDEKSAENERPLPCRATHILDVPINSRHSRSWAARPRCWQERRLPDVLQGIHPAPALALRWVCTSWAVWATT